MNHQSGHATSIDSQHQSFIVFVQPITNSPNTAKKSCPNPRLVCSCIPGQPPLSPKSLAHFSNSSSPFLLTLGRMLSKLASKSTIWIGRIWSLGVNKRASPRWRKGPIAASFASAVISDPEYPRSSQLVLYNSSQSDTYRLSSRPTSRYPRHSNRASDDPAMSISA